MKREKISLCAEKQEYTHKMEKIWLYFRLDDSERLLYKFKMGHKLNLILHFEDVDGKSITKQILLKPIKLINPVR